MALTNGNRGPLSPTPSSEKEEDRKHFTVEDLNSKKKKEQRTKDRTVQIHVDTLTSDDSLFVLYSKFMLRCRVPWVRTNGGGWALPFSACD